MYPSNDNNPPIIESLVGFSVIEEKWYNLIRTRWNRNNGGKVILSSNIKKSSQRHSWHISSTRETIQ